MDASLIVNIVFGTLALAWGIWKFFAVKRDIKYKEDLQHIRDYTDTQITTGKMWVDDLKSQFDKDAKYNTHQFEAIDKDIIAQDKRMRVLESQLVAKETVEKMLDQRVRPLEAYMEKMENTMEKGFKEVTDQLTLNEMNSHNTVVMISRLEGKLEGARIIGANRDD